MDKQIVFNTVVNHLRAQGKQASSSAGGGGGCFYRIIQDGKTLKCAVGCLIPDHLYLPIMENATVSGRWNDAGKRGALLRAALALVIPNFNTDPNGPDVVFLRELQKIHDRSSPTFWEEGFEKVAREHNLTIPSKE